MNLFSSVQDCLVAAFIICGVTTFLSAGILFKNRTQGWISALSTYPAWLYIAVRTAIGCGLLWLAHAASLAELYVKVSDTHFAHQFTATHLLYGAVAGVIPVYLLRTLSKAFPVDTEKDAEEDGFRKFIEMLLALENITVETIALKITHSRISKVRSTLPVGIDFLELCEGVKTGLHAFDRRQAAKVKRLTKKIDELITLYENERSKLSANVDTLDKNYNEKLAYAILNTFDEKTYRLLMTEQKKAHPQSQ